MAVLALSGCGQGQSPATSRSKSDATAATAAEPLDARTLRLWTRSCALCHVDGNAGAPRVGDTEAWGPRLAEGREQLLEHTVEGLNSMPPLGYCMACEREDFLAMIDFMAPLPPPSFGDGGAP